jgi:predicted phosphoribosyltransferase
MGVPCPAVSIVGTREVSDEGRARARRLAKELATAGIVVVSGLARGIDTAAHMGAIEAGGRTVYNGASLDTLDVASRVATKIGGNATAIPTILWARPQEKAHDGGRSRSYTEHKENLSVAAHAKQPIIVLDDVLTTGSQMMAACEKLHEAGMSVIGRITIIDVLLSGERGDPMGWRKTKRFF